MEILDLSRLQAADFERFLNDGAFEIRFTGDIAERASLVQVNRLSHYSPLERTPFSMVFRTAPGAVIFSQGIYRMSCPELGTFDLFLVPIASDSTGVSYEAVFS